MGTKKRKPLESKRVSAKKTIVAHNTADRKGRNILISPRNAPLSFLSVGRVLLDPSKSQVEIDSKNSEIAFVCLHGEGTIRVEEKVFQVRPFDGIYIPCDALAVVSTNSTLDLVECSAKVSKRYEPAHVQFSQVKDDPRLHASIGNETFHRELYQLVSENVKGRRILAGVTFSNTGNWTSWPPHEHRETLEEVYLFFDMPPPAYGIQLAYNDTQYPDVLVPVRENDAIVVSGGYHPNVAIPGHPINFVWMLCAKREGIDRKWGVVNVQPEYK